MEGAAGRKGQERGGGGEGAEEGWEEEGGRGRRREGDGAGGEGQEEGRGIRGRAQDRKQRAGQAEILSIKLQGVTKAGTELPWPTLKPLSN